MKNVLILLAVVAMTGIAIAEVVNGDFEGGTYMHGQGINVPNGWDAWQASWDGWGAQSHITAPSDGNPGSGVELGADTGNAYAVIFQHNALFVDPGTEVELSADIRDVAPAGNGDFAALKLEHWNGPSDTGTMILAEEIIIPDVTTSWANYAITTTVAEGADRMTVVLVTTKWTNDGIAAVYQFDNVVLRVAGGKATKPNPAKGAVVGSSQTELSWTNPDPNNPADAITCDVYFLDAGAAMLAGDPNMGPSMTDPGVVQIADDLAAEALDLNDALVSVLPLDEDHYYYWAVHCTDPHGDPNGEPLTSQGDVWYFYTGDAVPVVNAGPDEFAWVAKDDSPTDPDDDPESYYITVVGTYTDDGKSAIVSADFVNLGWDIANGDAGIEKVSQDWTPGSGVHTSGTVTAVFRTYGPTAAALAGKPETLIPGYWDLQLQVTDGTGMGQDVAYVRVDVDCATAAEADASDPYDGYFDANNDCIINMEDFAVFAEAWLNCNDNKLTTCP